MALTMLISGAYHACFGLEVCVEDQALLVFLDHTMAAGSTQIVLFCFLSVLRIIDEQLCSVLTVCAFIINAVFVRLRDNPYVVGTGQALFNALYSSLFLGLSICLASNRISLVRWGRVVRKGHYLVIYSRDKNGLLYKTALSARMAFSGFALCLVGYFVFSVSDAALPGCYDITHSAWHIISGTGVWLLICSFRRSEQKQVSFIK
jgi:hypothetical protein